ncbi:MotA/TolQ/ExbB proton channel family protein [Vibrio sp. 99-8-1]|uniref:MotA/TolQ/ExbB proton channel family protein n=1 Tax=Vibrio sp. 99-8-1 TaxID=2607602 RepID=UPI001493A6ED|nr:MotA/TolQ/ExbB proton channel family protein [Vibrio sp. 99-8-1]NOI65692.1 MotA/TolQ/ExbB proton channel family protein [Vibrio sp. 99-8-1]
MDGLSDVISIVGNTEWLATAERFMAKGGPILWWLAGLMTLFWTLVLERVWYLVRVFPRDQQRWFGFWLQRSDRFSWFAQAQRGRWLSEAKAKLTVNMSLLKLIVSLFPMLGLLGTVTGMISVFDVLATQGNADPQLMAAGISMATLPTMAGMVAALVSLFVYSRISRITEKRQLHLARLLRINASESGNQQSVLANKELTGEGQ